MMNGKFHISDMHPCTWPAHTAVLMDVSLHTLEIYSRQGGTVIRHEVLQALNVNTLAD